MHAIQVQQQASDRIGRAATVVEQGGRVGIAAAGCGVEHILLEGVEQVMQWLCRQLVRCDRTRQGCELARPARIDGWLAGQCAFEFGPVGRQFGQALGRARVAFVGDVVRRTRVVVERRDGRAQPRRTEPGSDGEVFVMVHTLHGPMLPQDGGAKAAVSGLTILTFADQPATGWSRMDCAGGEIGRRTRFRS